MADAVLHIKDGYFFEVPKFLWRRNFESRADFPRDWVKLDEDFQSWEAGRLYDELLEIVRGYNQTHSSAGELTLPAKDELLAAYSKWKHNHANLGKPLDEYLRRNEAAVRSQFEAWERRQLGGGDRSFDKFAAEHPVADVWFLKPCLTDPKNFAAQWNVARAKAGDVAAYQQDSEVKEWSRAKIAAYNKHLSGKILIPQYFGEIRNLHERESGICISKFMIVEVAVALLLIVAFRWLATKVSSGERPRGKLWNLLEGFLVFIRDQIARPAIGEHDAERFVPLLWTLFMFILGCNLCGMIPGIGSPTGAWGVTFGLATVTFATVVVAGMRQFGFLGFFKNQVPHMDLPLWIAVVIKPVILAIELLGLLIKHTVLSIRLLANMVAGHLVLVNVMGLAFGAAAALSYAHKPEWQWWLTAAIAVFGSTLFSILELFVAFLQAYVFTFLSALFIGASVHHH